MSTSEVSTSKGQDLELRALRRRVALSSYLGTLIEFYDFLLYGVAASIVFGPLFFADMSPSLALISSFATLAAGYFARPLGGAIFGHFGDRVGRKSMLFITLTTMGVASTLIGLLPTYEQIGNLAPALLVSLRLLQGIAVGGEWGGAMLMTLEHSEDNNRGFMSSLTNAGGPSGALLGTLMMSLFAALPDDQFLSWGWRVPFVLSALLLVVGVVVRRSVTESPIFEIEKPKSVEADGESIPLVELLRSRSGTLALLIIAAVPGFLIHGLLATFGVASATQIGGLDRSQVLLAYSLVTFIHIFTIPAYAALSDRVGRRPVMAFGSVGLALVAYPVMHALVSGSLWLVFIAFMALPLLQAAVYGPMAAFMGEAFGTRFRYTGSSLGYQIATTLGGGLGPLIAASLLGLAGGENPVYVAAMLVIASLLGVAALLRLSESYRTALTDDSQTEPTALEDDREGVA